MFLQVFVRENQSNRSARISNGDRKWRHVGDHYGSGPNDCPDSNCYLSQYRDTSPDPYFIFNDQSRHVLWIIYFQPKPTRALSFYAKQVISRYQLYRGPKHYIVANGNISAHV